MSMFDKILDGIRLNPDEDDDYGLDDEVYEEDEPVVRPRRERKAKIEKKKEENRFQAVKEKPPKSHSKVTPMRSIKRQGGNMEVCVIKPTSMEDAREITDTLLSGRTVVLNLEGLDAGNAQRITDFTSGSCYAIGGNLQKISNSIFVITPQEVELSGDFLDSMEGLDVPTIQTEVY